MVDGLFFCAILTGRRGGHSPFVQAGVETSDTGAEAVKPDPHCSWESHSRRVVPVSGLKVQSLVVFSTTPHSIGDPRRAHHFCCCRHDELMGCAASTNGCLDLRRRPFAPGRQVSAEWSRCPGSMSWHTGDGLHCDEAHRVGCLRGWEGCPLV